jgi:hypothetical protein
VTALVHFNVNKERDFRFESSQDSLRAVQKQLKLRRYQAHAGLAGQAVFTAKR